MRIKSLYIDDYKNIKKQTFDFSNNSGYIALIGENGSGKSNLLEAIGLIFNGLFNNKKIPFAYELTYEYDGKEYSRKPRISTIDGVKVKETEMSYPSPIIACYSGEDTRLWHLAYEDYYLSYFNRAIKENFYIPKMLYVDKNCWEIALITLLCATEQPEIAHFLDTCLNIKDVSSVTISFSIDEKKREIFIKHDAMKWFMRVISDGKNNVNAKTLSTTDVFSLSLLAQKQKKSRLIFQYLYLLSQPKRNDVNKVDKFITGVSININEIDFINLSEGEKKLILIECITKVLGDSNSLVLLDEPDAHTHIARKKDILKIIESFEGTILLTTHSPIFVNEIYKQEKNNLFFIENGSVVESNYINSLVRLASGEIDFLNGSILLSSKKILVTEGPYDKRYIEKAISALKQNNKQYEKFNQIAIIPSGSADNTKTFYEQILKSQIDKYDKIVFLFDYDIAGYNGWNYIRSLQTAKIASMFYQDNYDYEKNKKPEETDTIMVEDLFSPESYKKKVENAHLSDKYTHKDFRCFTENLASSIKKCIQNNYSDFKDEWFNGFKPVLDKLLEVFNLE